MPAIKFLNKKIMLLLSTAFLMAISCKEEPTVKEPFDKSLLINKWYLHSGQITENGIQKAMTIDSCKQDDFIQLNPENKMIFFYGTNKCSPQEPDSLSRYWHIIDGELDLDNIFYEIISVTPDSMNLRRRFTIGLGESLIAEYYYLN